MNCLIVTTHPLNDSLCNILSNYVENRLVEMGHEVIVEDLYAERFEPVLTVKERESYYNSRYDSSGVTVQVNRLKNAEALILVFPTWWFGFPAMLKGWFDRVWGPGIAYDHANDYGPITPRLNKLRKVLVVTTLGSPWWVDLFIMRQPVKRIIKMALLGTCAKKSKLQFFSLYNSERLNEKKIEAFKRKVGSSLNTW